VEACLELVEAALSLPDMPFDWLRANGSFVMLNGKLNNSKWASLRAKRGNPANCLSGHFWIALKDSDPLWAEAHGESYAASLRSSQ
jgi:hypothetical protein